MRNKKVMLDFDLAQMYAVETKQLKRQVKRNPDRFPKDFMFVLSKKEFENLRSQIGTSSLDTGETGWGGTRYLPLAFTEQGVSMLSSVLNSPTAIEVNIRIFRVFCKMRELLLSNREILLKLEQVEKKMILQDGKINQYDRDIQLIFEALKKLLGPRQRIGLKP